MRRSRVSSLQSRKLDPSPRTYVGVMLGAALAILLIKSGVSKRFLVTHSELKGVQKQVNDRSPAGHPGEAGEGPSKGSDQARGAADQPSDETKRKIQILNEILQSKNDNDPRLDQEFKDLRPETREALKAHYEQLKVEMRNERGTIVFLLGRNLDSKADFDFLKKVVQEPPCLSLADCAAVAANSGKEEVPGLDVTLEYPKIVAIKSVKNYLAKNSGSPNSPEGEALARQILVEAKNSTNQTVRRMVQSDGTFAP